MEIFTNFVNELFGKVRTVKDDNGEIWFSATDVAYALGYENPTDAIKTHVYPEDTETLIFKASSDSLKAYLWDKASDYSKKVVINESGMYALIFGSRLETAKEFKRWVTKEVLPSIRENGGYILGQEHLSKEEMSFLKAEIAKLKASVDRLQKRRHEILRELKAQKELVKGLKDKDKKAKRIIMILTDDINSTEKLYIKTLNELGCLQKEIKKYKKNGSAENISDEEITFNDTENFVTVDSNGFIVF